jgi:hypothetical protein
VPLKLYPDSTIRRKKWIATGGLWIRLEDIRADYLSLEDRADLIALARDGSATHRLGRRANALVLLDDGWSCERVAAALFLNDDAIRR